MTLAEQTASFAGVRAVVVDIEGTTSASAYVYNVLFPFATRRFGSWISEHRDEPETAAIIADIGRELGQSDPSQPAVVLALTAWVAEDRKVTALKTLQGLIWQEGFASGELESHFFPDALEALGAWHVSGLPVYVFSSGSVLAQRNWFGHTSEGDVTGWITDYFDTANAGPKREADSYQVIAQATGHEPTGILFCSDVVAELQAAHQAGWQVVRVRREGEPHAVGDSAFAEVSSLLDIDIDS